MAIKKTLDEFIKDAIQIHGFVYDYSRVNYINNKTKIEILCNTHRFFSNQARFSYYKEIWMSFLR